MPSSSIAFNRKVSHLYELRWSAVMWQAQADGVLSASGDAKSYGWILK